MSVDRSRPAVTGLVFDLDACEARATVEPGPNGTTIGVMLWEVQDDGKKFEVGPMQLEQQGPPEVWVYRFQQGKIPAGRYEAEATIQTIQRVGYKRYTQGGDCGQSGIEP